MTWRWHGVKPNKDINAYLETMKERGLKRDGGRYLNIDTYFRTSTVPTSASKGEKRKKKTA